MAEILHKKLTDVIIGAFYDVYNELGYGFLEKVYENALAKELQKRGHSVVTQQPINVYYQGDIVGEYFADIIVDRKVILELKCAAKITKAHQAQLINYLKATDAEVGLVLNFGGEPSFSRRVFKNSSD